LQIIFHKRATEYRSLLRKMTYKDKGSYECSPPCTSSFCSSTLTLLHPATHCNTLHHTATHCNTLQHTATHCNYIQVCCFHGAVAILCPLSQTHTHMCVCGWVCACVCECICMCVCVCACVSSLRGPIESSVLQRVAACCRVLQCVAVCCSVLQCVAVCCSVLCSAFSSSQ